MAQQVDQHGGSSPFSTVGRPQDVYKRQVLAGCDVVIDHTYHTRACQQAMMETFRTYCSIDAYGLSLIHI